MALKIKKQVKNSDGTITELEGTEAEIEAFLKKENKKRESSEKKKNLILGKEAQDLVREIVRQELAKQPVAQTHHIHHNWYHTNGWWWRPYYNNGVYLYQYTSVDPNVITSDSYTYSTFNSAVDMASHLGLDTNYVTSLMAQNGDQNIAASGLSIKTNGESNWTATTDNQVYGSYCLSTLPDVKCGDTVTMTATNSVLMA